MISPANQAAFSVGANLAQRYAREWCAMTYAQREAHEFDIMHYIDSLPNKAPAVFTMLFDVSPAEAQLAVDVAEWLVCNAGMFENMNHIDQADLVVNQL